MAEQRLGQAETILLIQMMNWKFDISIMIKIELDLYLMKIIKT